ncbi:general stress protein [Micromonospora pattaloongensis]|nr:general stress protein [Micromonospora pattaloongensis]
MQRTGTISGPAAMPSGDGGVVGRPTVTIATYPEYAPAQRAVDYLSDNRFPVERSAIVGTDLRLVEDVLGRMTTGRAALAGAGSGAWFGLLIGLLFGIFTPVNWLGAVVTAVVIGAFWGGVFGAVAHAMTRGSRDFTSYTSVRASQYSVNIDADLADQARQVLGRMDGQSAPSTR